QRRVLRSCILSNSSIIGVGFYMMAAKGPCLRTFSGQAGSESASFPPFGTLLVTQGPFGGRSCVRQYATRISCEVWRSPERSGLARWAAHADHSEPTRR